MKSRNCFIIGVFFLTAGLNAQTSDPNPGVITRAYIDGNDTIPCMDLDAIYVFPINFASYGLTEAQYRRLIYNVRKAYPYAKMAGAKFREIDYNLAKINSRKERKKYIEKVEEDLKLQFEEDLKKLTVTQGRILIRLIDRETGQTSYALVKELRGSFSAFFWQSMARLFSSNLKSQYDPSKGEDRVIEDIIVRLELGIL